MMELEDVSSLAAQLEGVVERRREGLLDWRYRGRLIARQLDERSIVIRATFEFRDILVHSFPETFSAPGRFAKHMMVVADIQGGNPTRSRTRSPRRGSCRRQPEVLAA